MPSVTLLNKCYKIHLEHILVGLSTIISIPQFSPLYSMSKTFLSCVVNGEIETSLIPGPWPLTDKGRSVSLRSVQRWYLGVDSGRERETQSLL